MTLVLTYLIVLGLALSFAVFTLFGTLILASLHLPGGTVTIGLSPGLAAYSFTSG